MLTHLHQLAKPALELLAWLAVEGVALVAYLLLVWL